MTRVATGAPPNAPKAGPPSRAVAEGSLSPRAFVRHAAVRRALGVLEKDAKAGVAAQTSIVAANAKLKITAFDWQTNKPKKAVFLKLPPLDATGKRILDLTVLMSVSGHTQQADEFARTNTYSIRVTTPDQRAMTMTNIRRSAPVEYATAQDVSFELEQGVTIIEAWPEGSAGPVGYNAGRVIHLVHG